MLFAANYCPKCNSVLKSILIFHRYNEKESVALPKEYCPACNTIELTGDDVDYFIFGGNETS